MKVFFRLPLVVLSSIILVSSCSKNNGGSGNTPVVILPDTLNPGWVKIEALPRENFTDIFFTDNSTGFVVSGNGIYKTNNAGTDWTKINNSTNIIHFGVGSSNNASFVDGSFLVLTTQDGGSNFINASYPYIGGGEVGFFDCFFADPNTCYFSSNQYIWKSVNAAASLDTVFRFSNISATSSLFFLNDQQGWVLRQDGIYETADGGDTWIVDTALVNAYGSIQFLDIDNGYASNYGKINRTVNGGTTWDSIYQFQYKVYADLDFINTNEGYCSIANRVYKTTDAGATWEKVAALGNENISKIHFTDANHGWACTSNGVLKFSQ